MTATAVAPTVATTVAPTVAPAEVTTGRLRARSLWGAGLVAGLVAAVATTGVAAAARASGVPVETGPGLPIPLVGFANLTIIFVIVGLAIAHVVGRVARRPRSTFTRTAVALTVLSCVPDVLLPTDIGSQATLIVTHLVAAAIVIPVVARRLPAARS